MASEFLIVDEENENLNEWKQTRTNIFIILCFESLLFGIELTVLEPTEYFYFKDIIRSDHSLTYYSLCVASGVVTSLVSSLTISHVIKKYPLYSGTFLWLLLFSIFGYGLYLIPNSSIFVICGRLIAGFGKTTNLISSMYTQKLYSLEDLPKRVAILSNFVTIGSIIGPCLSYLFLSIDDDIGTLHLTYGNSPGFYLLTCKFILLMLGYFMLHDIPHVSNKHCYTYTRPKIFNVLFYPFSNTLSKELYEESNEKFIINEAGRENEKVSFAYVMKGVFNKDTILIFLVLIFFGISFKIINTLLPVEALEFLSWKVPQNAALSISNAVFGTITSVILVFCYEYTNHYLNLLGGMTVNVLSIILLTTLPLYSAEYLPGAALFCFMSVLNVLSSCLLGLSIRVILLNTLSERFKVISDAFRACLLKISYFIAALLIPLVHLNVTVSGYVALVLAFGLIFATILKLKKKT